jgi:hypothetical protein
MPMRKALIRPRSGKTHEIEYEEVEKKTKTGNSPLIPIKVQLTRE